MVSRNSDYDRRRVILCIRSRRATRSLDQALERYENCVVHDARTACRKARLGSFDLYLAVDPHSTAAAIECWHGVREFDCNTPFLFLLRRRLPVAIEDSLVAGRDAFSLSSEPYMALSNTIEHLLRLAEQRSMEARREEMLAIREQVQERLAQLEWRAQLSRESMARAQEHVMRAYALQRFTRLGGTRSFFDRLWADVYEDALLQHPQVQTPSV